MLTHSTDTADSADNVPSATAIAKGLAAGHTAEKPAYWIHVSGTNILTWYDDQNGRSGEAPLPEQEYHDVNDIEKIINIPDVADHRDVDKIVLAGNSDAVKVAIVTPPTIYGSGTGPVNTRSVQVPSLAKGTLEKGFAPIVGVGKTEWDHVHVKDLADLFLKLVEATQDSSKKDNTEIFGPHGYFFARAGWHKWADVATWIAEEASKQGFLPEALTKSVTLKEATQIGGTTWGQNSKGVAERASKYLGWSPKNVPLKDTIAEVVSLEAKSLGLTPKEKKG